MLSSAGRIATRRILTLKPIPARRLLSTAPPAQRSRSWKSSAVRWGAAIGGIWYYNTSSVFAEEPDAAIERTTQSLLHIQDSSLPTVDAIVHEKRERAAQVAQQAQVAHEASASVEDLEEEADQQGAFNPETGEINWDCPCLGGMAHGPCGPQFKEAFSCFVFSKEEPKGMDCIDKFKGMQDCFREHPDHYGAELEDDDEEFDDVDGTEVAVARDGEAPTPPASAAEKTKSTPVAERTIEPKPEPTSTTKAVESPPAVVDQAVQNTTPKTN